jgi:PucR family transcriptional regulator, purine catabolism regulatory protein
MVEVLTTQPLTVREVLAAPDVRRAEPEVLAGAAGLGNEVRWVHAGEVPNIATLLQGGELLLSTGMGVGPGANAQRRFVADLAQRGIAALAIELGTAMPEVPAPLVKAAEEGGLCLIAFHHQLRFVEITEMLQRALIDRGGELLRQGEELHKRFTSLMLGGAHVSDILVELSRFIRNPVILERSGAGVAYQARHQADEDTVMGAWGSYKRNLVAAPDAVSECVPTGGGDTWGRLVALAVDSPLEAQDRVAVERSVGLIALAMMRAGEEEDLTTRRRSDFLASLATTRAGGKEIAVRAAGLGFTPRGDTLLPVAMDLPSRAEGDAHESTWAAFRSDLADELERHAIPLLAGIGERGEALFVMGISRVGDRRRLADLLADLAERGAGRRLGGERPTICVGAACEGWSDVARALAAASQALPAAVTLESRPWHDVTIASADSFLFAVRDRPELRDLTELSLRPLIELDRRGRGSLMETLAVYFEKCGRKADTAAALQIKRQTLYHRLSRIEEALDADLDDGPTRLALHLALRADRYLALATAS